MKWNRARLRQIKIRAAWDQIEDELVTEEDKWRLGERKNKRDISPLEIKAKVTSLWAGILKKGNVFKSLSEKGKLYRKK